MNEENFSTFRQNKAPKNNLIDPISVFIFLTCIILSFVIIFFIGNPKEEQKETKTQKAPVKAEKNIPGINKIWNTALPKAENTTKQETQKTIEVEQQNHKQENKTEVPKTVIPIHKQPAIPQKQQLTQQVNKKNTQLQPTNTPSKIQNTQQIQTQPSTPKVQTLAPQSSQTQTASVNKQELTQYKINLRNKIASRINFANIIGDGTCTVSFTVSPSGILQNRKFKKQSDNFTLNDVVYNAMMQTPSYNPPPNGYKNETMNFSVRFYNGNYEVSLY